MSLRKRRIDAASKSGAFEEQEPDTASETPTPAQRRRLRQQAAATGVHPPSHDPNRPFA